MKFDTYGREIPDPRPVELPTGLRVRPTLQEEIQRYIRAEMSLRARDQGMETFEEANDFDIEDDWEPIDDDSPYTLRDMIPEPFDVDASTKPEAPPAPPDSGAQPSK